MKMTYGFLSRSRTWLFNQGLLQILRLL